MTVVKYIFKSLQLSCVVFLFTAFTSTQVFAGVPELLAQGDHARMMEDYPAAEKAYTEALAKEPGNYRILKSLVEVKFFQKKYAEVKPLAEKVLSLEVTLQKKVNVFMQGEPAPLEAELVDETVVAPDFGKSNMTSICVGGIIFFEQIHMFRRKQLGLAISPRPARITTPSH